MAPAKKRRGFRNIVADEVNYVWRGGGGVTIQLADSPSNGSQLQVDYGYFDVWLYVNDRENRPPDFEPKSVTPSFVADAIRFARIVGWQPESDKKSRTIYYRDNQFREQPEEQNNSEQDTAGQSATAE